MSLYVGFYSAPSERALDTRERARDGSGPDPKMQELVAGLPDQLPDGTEILGSYGTGPDVINGRPLPNVMIVESRDTDGLQFIASYYQGYLVFQWVPAVSVGTTRAAREAMQAATGQLAEAASR